MTVKQFGYLAGGAILAYISYKLPLPFFFTWPLATVFALGGIGFAFVPIEDRPMDIWVLSFIKSVYSPTQFTWSRNNGVVTSKTPATANTTQSQPQQSAGDRAMPDVLRGVFTPPPSITHISNGPPSGGQAKVLTKKTQTNPLSWLVELFSFAPPRKTPAVAISAAQNFSTPNITGRHIDMSPPPVVSPNRKNEEETLKKTQEKEEELETKVSTLKQELAGKSMTEARVLELQKQLTEILSEKEKMETELATFRRQAAQSSTPATITIPAVQAQTGTHVATPQMQKQTTVKIITPEGAIKAGLPRLTTFPNIVTGITKDSENNFLPGVLVTVKDKDGVPLRALKTNRLGQFAASTPLANGVYFVEIEDPRARYVFDRVQITLNGSIVPALEIIAKNQKQVNREKLAKEIFGNMN